MNLTYPHAWRYRDYVIAAFNADKPFDRFVASSSPATCCRPADDRQRAEQAGRHRLPRARPEVAQRAEPGSSSSWTLADEQIDATTQAFLGLTVACARCHDHKFDPIPQRDYYALAGIFRSTETLLRHHPGRSRTTAARPSCWSCRPGRTRRRSASGCRPTPGPTWSGSSSRLQARQREIARGGRQATQGNAEYLRRQAQIHLLESPAGDLTSADGTPRPLAMAVRDRRQPADSPLYIRGEPDKPGEVVPRGLPQVLTAGDGRVRSRGPRPARAGRLARVRPDNPLTARVMVNRVWLHLFGQGLVPTPDNFGASRHRRRRNPELLDPLAVAVHGRRLVGEAADPPARAEPRLPAGVRVRRPQPRGRPRQRAGLADEPRAGSRPRRSATRCSPSAGKLDADPAGRVAGGAGRRRTVGRDAAVRPADRSAQRPVGLPAGRPRPPARTSLAAVRLRRPEPGDRASGRRRPCRPRRCT